MHATLDFQKKRQHVNNMHRDTCTHTHAHTQTRTHLKCRDRTN